MDVKDKLVTLEELGTAVDHMSDELEDAVAQTIASRDIESLFTNRDSHFDSVRFYAKRKGNVVFISFCLRGGITDGTRLFSIDDSIQPMTANVLSALFSSSGVLVTDATVWIEANNTSKATFYGTTLPSGLYFGTLMYFIK